MVQKILSSIVLFMLIFSVSSPLATAELSLGDAMFPDQEYLDQQLEATKSELMQVPWGSAAIEKIDTFFEQNGHNTELIMKLERKLNNIVAETPISGKNELIVGYLFAKIDMSLSASYALKQEQMEQETEKIVEQAYHQTLTQAEQDEAEKAILELQSLLYNQGNAVVEDIIWEFESYANRKEVGNLEMNLDATIQGLWDIQGSMNLSDYESKSKLLNSQLSGHLSGMIESTIQGQGMKAEFDSFIDFLSVDGNSYFLAKDMNFDYSGDISEIMNENEKQIIEKLKQYAQENVYIRIQDQEAQAAFSSFQDILSNWFGSEAHIVLQSPMFEAYAKKEWKYILKPTKHFCDTMKKLTDRFDPIHGKQCSQWQYNDLLSDLAESGGMIYLTTGTTNKIGYMMSAESAGHQDMYMEFTKAYIKTIHSEVVSPYSQTVLDYERHSHIDFMTKAEDSSIVFDGALDSNWVLKQAQGEIIIEGTRIATMTLENWDFSAHLDYTDTRYDWNTNSTVDSYRVTATMEGLWDDGFDMLKIQANGVDLSDQTNSWNMQLNYGTTGAHSLSGNMQVLIQNTPIVTVETTGSIQSEYVNIQGDIMVNMAMFTGNNETMDVDIDVMTDTRDNKNNIEIDINADLGSQWSIDFSIENQGQVLPFDGEIQAPEQYIDIEEALGEEQMQY